MLKRGKHFKNFFHSNFCCGHKTWAHLETDSFYDVTCVASVFVCRARTRGGTQQMFIWGGSVLWSNPLPFYIPFFTKKVPLLYTFYWKVVPLSHTFVRTLHPLTAVRLNRTFSRLYKAIQFICWPFYRPKWQISLPFYILQLVKSLPFHTFVRILHAFNCC